MNSQIYANPVSTKPQDLHTLRTHLASIVQMVSGSANYVRDRGLVRSHWIQPDIGISTAKRSRPFVLSVTRSLRRSETSVPTKSEIQAARREIQSRRRDLDDQLQRIHTLERVAVAQLESLKRECRHPAAFKTSHTGETCRDCPDCGACGL